MIRQGLWHALQEAHVRQEGAYEPYTTVALAERLQMLISYLSSEHPAVYDAAEMYFADPQGPISSSDDELDREAAAAQVFAALVEDPGEPH